MSIDETVAAIRAHHRAARFALKQRIRLERAFESFVVFNLIGATPGDKTGLKKAYAEAGKTIKNALTDPGHDLHKMAVINAESTKPWVAEQREHESYMANLVVMLPAYAWVKALRGFGALGFAQIIGECGDLSNYSTVSKLWKRLGLAVMNGRRQGAPGPNASAETWTEHGYNPSRRSVVWNVGESLLKHQSRRVNNTTGVLVCEAGPYRAIYEQRKAYERPRVASDGHAHNRATRYMTKSLIADLWSAWRRASFVVKPTNILSDAPFSG